MPTFPNEKIKEKLSSSRAEFDMTASAENPDLLVYDETIELLPLYTAKAVVNAYIWPIGDPEHIVLPEIDVHKKLLIFKGVSHEDEITICGNHYEILCSTDGDTYDWYLSE